MDSIRLSGVILFLLLQLFSSTDAQSPVTDGVEYELPDIRDHRIINGSAANHSNTMHQVSIRRRVSDSFFFGSGHICGASVIAPTIALSAAHCFVNYNSPAFQYMNPSNFIAVMGILNRFEKDNNTLVYNINQIFYGRGKLDLSTYQDDIALLFLDGTVPDNHPTVRPISMNKERIPAETICQVSGWGRTELTTISDILMIVDVPMLSKETCSNETLFPPNTMRDGMICAGHMSGERDACTGDSGGPLVCNNLLVGIVSFGFGCAEARLPGVYTDVAYFEPWVQDKLQKANQTLKDVAT